ncbi:hypothetical protein [Marivirga harenae]|uniref:hypothetical protein n=1 Tax=Marivirga harenae TaxID=2010992 RepID=UPI0026DF5429|nr:hypothetical protein [Marivirga harenae]WKV13364.1 hypothetical protein Q3Y49_05925 [Marivirga harenae]|tara:strand:+ start:195404 stop:196039 length:636 start_codon:yes stop_codon:yes gene_type:complete
MKTSLVFIFFLCFPIIINAQAEPETKKPYQFEGKIGVGLTAFNVTGYHTENYPATAIRLGGMITRPIINDRIRIGLGLNLFYRDKSESLLDGIYYYGRGYPLHRLDETAIQRHLAFEFPINFQYLLSSSSSIAAGFMVRQWATNKNVDLLSSQMEYGIIAGFKQNLVMGMSIGLDVFTGFDFYNALLVTPSRDGRIGINNHSILLIAGYDF